MKNLLLPLYLLLTPFILFSQEKQEEILKTFHSISSHEILDFAKELSSEKYKGRLSGSPEYLQAAEWCATKFKEWGVQPANNGSYFQYFPNAQSCNVVGLIEGSDPVLKEEVIIVGGHLDGQGYLGVTFPSALDNASGVADILGAAKSFAA